MSPADQIRANVARVRDEIAVASRRSGRTEDDVRLVAVTKYVSSELTKTLFDVGCQDLGESRPQQLWDKSQALSSLPIRWHMIGHLQRNKLKRTLPAVSLLHSIDSLRLLNAVQTWAAENERAIPVLIEVNISRDTDKHGFAPDETEAAIRAALASPTVAVRGLMCMAGLDGGPEAARDNFRELRALRDRLRLEFSNDVDLDELSMGMSRDFPIAIEEGATIVRVGSTLFEGVDR